MTNRHHISYLQKTDFDNGKIYFWAKAMSPNENSFFSSFSRKLYQRIKSIRNTELLPPLRTSLPMMSCIAKGRVKHNHSLLTPNRFNHYPKHVRSRLEDVTTPRPRVWLVAGNTTAYVIPSLRLRLVKTGFCCLHLRALLFLLSS